jgi:hypothetical protein
MIQTILNHGRVLLLSEEDADLLDVKWTASPDYNEYTLDRFYAQRGIYGDGKQKHVSLHRIILERMIGRPLTPKELTDHIDGDGLNDQRENLRLANKYTNGANLTRRHPLNTTGYRNVYWRRGQWHVAIRVKRVLHNIGRFDDKIFAAAMASTWRELHQPTTIQ